MSVESKMQIANCKMKNEKCGGWYLTPRSPLPAPRSALSLTEVLIAMGILSLGLLGVASVFPVGSFYMQKAEISDKASAIGQSVMNDIMARGMLNPRAWYVMVPNPRTTVPNVWNTGFPSDSKYSPIGAPKPGSFTRILGLALSEGLNQSNDKAVLARQFGSAYVIDPIGISSLALTNGQVPTQSLAHGPAAVFPASAYYASGYYLSYSAAWSPWLANSNPYAWPIRRATFRQPSSGWQMDAQMAEHYFRSNDDLSYDFPERDDRPSMQTWDTNTANGATTPLARKWAGDYSWIVTVAPSTNAARDGMATNPQGFAYDVSVVVFYKRALPDSADSMYPVLGSKNIDYLSAMSQNERAVKANVISTGLNGGELLLTDWQDVVDTTGKVVSAFDQLRTGHWIMLCGPHPNSNLTSGTATSGSTGGEPRFALNWYQVITVEQAQPGLTGYDSARPQRVISVRGPEWAWQPSATVLCVAICKGAVAVHSKSIRLESGVDGAFNNAGGPTTTQNPYWP
jgi:hypothetical protein